MKACPDVAATGFNLGLQVRVALMAARPAGQHHAHVAGSKCGPRGRQFVVIVAHRWARWSGPVAVAMAGAVGPHARGLAALNPAQPGNDRPQAEAQARVERVEAATAAERERAAAALADERAKTDALRMQIDVLNAEMVEARAEAERAMADERMRAGRLSAQVEALSAEVMRADAAKRDKERAEADRDAERGRADALQGSRRCRQRGGVDVTEAIRQAEAMVHSFREAQAGEVNALKAERHRLATQIDGFATRADQAEARTDSLRARVDVLQRERDTARAEAVQAAEALQRGWTRLAGARGPAGAAQGGVAGE